MIDINKYIELLNAHEVIMGHHDTMFENQAENERFQRKSKAQKKYVTELEKQRALSNATFNKVLEEFLKNEGYQVKLGAKNITKKRGNPFAFFARIFKRKKITAELECSDIKQLTNVNVSTNENNSTPLVPIKQEIVTEAQKITEPNELENQAHIEEVLNNNK